MQFETGDYIETPTARGVVLHVEHKPYNMGEILTTVENTGRVETFDAVNDIANWGRTRSDHHQWSKGQKADYDSLVANGRRLYDQIRTRVGLDHAVTFRLVTEHLPNPIRIRSPFEN